MMNDKATIYLTSLVGFGAVVLTLITTFLHTTLIGYMVILMLFCTAFFVINCIVIICLFIIRFRPV